MKGTNLMKTIQMKKEKIKMKRERKTSPSLFFFTSSLLIFLLLSCDDQPFKAGLGAVVDTRPPSVALTDPDGDMPIYGVRTFRGTAEDDYKLDRVELRVTNYPEGSVPDIVYLREWTTVKLETSPQNKGKWTIPIDTKQFPDGYLKILIRVWDSVRSEPFTTDEYVFRVQNDLPMIKLTSPPILEDDQGEGRIIQPSNNAHLNWGNYKHPLPPSISYNRWLAPRSPISGTISYEQDANSGGIYTGPRSIQNGVTRYPPQYRLWRISDVPAAGEYRLGQWPSEAQVPWIDFTNETNNPEITSFNDFELKMVGLGRYTFSTTPEGSGFWGFEVRAQSEDGRVKFHYPRDSWPDIEDKGLDWDNPVSSTPLEYETMMENRFVLLYVNTTEDPTIVKFWNLEDVQGEQNAAPGNYNNGVYTELTFAPDEPHSYVDEIRVNKNGDFKVRVNASHARGIQSALAFWESETSKERGVFIWDTNVLPYTVPASEIFSYWGFVDSINSSLPQERQELLPRNFIYTYTHDAPTGHIWKYTGTTAWNTAKGQIEGITLEELAEYDGWAKYTGKLTEDTYIITVNAFSTNGVPGQPMETRSVRLDFTPPEITINDIGGAYSKTPSSGAPASAIVNEVIKPSVRINDQLGVREPANIPANAYYASPNGTRSEQRYLLVDNASKTAMDDLIDRRSNGGTDYWPPVPAGNGNTSMAATSLPPLAPETDPTGVTIVRHGAIFGDAAAKDFTFKTTELYEAPGVGTALGDGDYWLYVFARDRAFNIGSMAPVKITVDASTNKPEVEYRNVNTAVHNDTLSPAGADGLRPNFYETAGGIPRNRLSGTLNVTLRDDDSLDLGTSAAQGNNPSSVKINIAGVTQDIAGVITVSPDVSVSDSQVRNIFAPQSVISGTRQAVRQLPDVQIRQNFLAAALSASKTNGGHDYDYLFANNVGTATLPEGIYRISVDVSEYAPAKLAVPSEADSNITTENARRKVEPATTQHVWVFVDTTPPAFANVAPAFTETPQWITAGVSAGWRTFAINGKISDRNGPVTLAASITNRSGGKPAITGGLGGGDWDSNVQINVVESGKTGGEKYSVDFAATVRIHESVSSDFLVKITATDRFNNANTIEQVYQLDSAPPNVTLKTPMTTFTRQNTRLPGSVGNVQYTRLANGILSFDLSAADDQSAVAEVRYWLLPASGGTAVAPANVVWGYTGLAESSTTALAGKHEKLTSNFGRTLYIDTTKLTDGIDYALYVMASDTAGTGNISAGGIGATLTNNSGTDGTAHKQTIFVKQSEDAPWIIDSTLQGVVGAGSTTTITINDDDGFYTTASGTIIRTNSTVRIWLSNPGDATIPANSTATDDAHVNANGYVLYPVPVNQTTNSPFTVLRSDKGNQNISLSLNFLEVPAFAAKLLNSNGTNNDTRVHYVVEVVDSFAGKFINETSGTPATVPGTATSDPPAFGPNDTTYTRSRREHYTFVRDTTLPVATITNAATLNNEIFGSTGIARSLTASPVNFTINGAISDANLKRDGATSDVGNYTIGIFVDNGEKYATSLPNPNPDEKQTFILGNAEGNGLINTASGSPRGIQNNTPNPGDTQVNFVVPKDGTTGILDAMGYSGLSQGRHTLVIMAEDRSGQKGASSSVVFFKDTEAPTFDFVRGFNDSKTTLPTIMGYENPGQTWWTALAGASGWSDAQITDYRTKRDALRVITHDGSGTPPSITGTFTDGTSNIARGGSALAPNSTFKIIWDNGAVGSEITIPTSQMGDAGKTVSWTVYLTNNGQPTGTVLPDGVHSIRLTVADEAGNVMAYTAGQYGFRIVSATPTAELRQVNGVSPLKTPVSGQLRDNPAIQKVYGDRALDNPPATSTVFTLTGTGISPNLSDVRVNIKYTDTPPTGSNPPAAGFEWSIVTPANAANTLTWAFTTALDTLTWTLPITRSHIMQAGGVVINDTNTILPGNYEVRIIARDGAGKLSGEVDNQNDGATPNPVYNNVWTFAVDAKAPEFTFNLQTSTNATPNNNTFAPSYWLTNATTLADRNVLGESPSIRGRISDAMSNLDVAQVQLAKWDYAASAWTIYKFGSTAPAEGTQNTFVAGNTTNPAHVDFWTNVTPALVPNTVSDYTVNWAFAGVAPAQLTDGYYSVRLRARDVSKVKVSAASPGWSAADNDGNPAHSQFVYFFIDTKKPVFTVFPANATHSTRYVTAANAPNPNPNNIGNTPKYGLLFPIQVSDDNMFETMKVTVARIHSSSGGTDPTIAALNNANDTTVWRRPKRSGTGPWVISVPIPFTPREVVPASGTRPRTPTVAEESAGLPDGAYKVTFEVTDLAGKTESNSVTITLDNRAPTASVAEPRFQGEFTGPNSTDYRFASDPQTGGEAFPISGSTGDAGLNGSASMPKEIWYRIGYGTQAVTSLPTFDPLPANPTDAQRLTYQSARSAAIMAWAVDSGSGLDLTDTGATYDRGALSNAAFEAAAKRKQGSLWFKYTVDTAAVAYETTTATYDVPRYFSTIAANPDPYTLALTAQANQSYQASPVPPDATALNSVATNYARGVINFRGRTFINGANTTGGVEQWLARQITPANLPADMQDGFFSLPLVIRTVDNAGNASYELRDIWLYPNGDNPRSNILNPSERFSGRGTPRGGQFAIDGFAQDNVSVRRVIYRVKVDTTQTTNVNGGDAPTNNTLLVKTSGSYPSGSGGIVVMPNATMLNFTNPTAGTVDASLLAIWNSYRNPATPSVDGSFVTSGGRTDTATVLTKDGWYMANLDESQLYAANMPWNFMLNAGREITDLIAAKGFTYESSQMLRVWVEVLVFDGSPATAAGSFNRMSLGDNNINADNPRPYVREFFMTASEPSITTPQISNRLDTNGNATDTNTRPNATLAYASYNVTLTEDNVRGGRFGVRATLNSGGNTNINEIAVRLHGESALDSSNQPLAGWRNVYVRGGTGVTLPNGVTLRNNGANWTGGTAGNANARTAELTYAFSSTANASSTAQEMVRSGAWAKSGGNFTVDIRVRDSNNPPAEAVYTFEVGVDNFIPLADTAKNITNTKVAGNNAQFLGRVFDYQGSPNATTPPHRKIKEVVVWFTNQAGLYIRMNDGGTGDAPAAGAGTATTNIWTSQQNTITWSTANPNDVTNIALSSTAAVQNPRNIPTTANYFKRINEESGSGTTWSPSKIGTAEDVYWSFVQDTTILPDGWMKMHYVVVDQANNRSYYTQDMLVCNNYPIITNITLYTNNTGEGAVFTTHEGNEASTEYPIPTGVDGKTIPYASGYLNSGFISKNSVIGFGVDTIGTKSAPNQNGNTPLYYQARFVERYLVPLTKDNLIAMAGAGVTDTNSGMVTRSLDRLPNTVYFNDAGNLVNSAGTPTTAPATTSDSGFLDLYTIATGNSGRIPGGDAVWRLLGVPSLTPKDGSHFVFQGINVTSPADPRYNADNNVNNMTGFPNVYVYAYKQVGLGTGGTGGTPIATGAKVPVKPPAGSTTANPNRMMPDDLNISGSAYFAGTAATIREAQANNPLNAMEASAAGTAFFLVKVYDTVNQGAAAPAGQTALTEKDMLYDAVVIGMRVFLSDSTNPKARLYDLNPYTETAVIGNNINDTFKQQTLAEAAAPTAIGSNIKRGGLYNIGTEREPVKSGYIDPRSASLALNPWVNYPSDPTLANPYLGSRRETPNGLVAGDNVSLGTDVSQDKVSGSVILRGLAWDDQLIDEVRVNINNQTTAKVILKLQYVYPDGHVWTNTTAPDAAAIQSNNLTRKMMPVAGETGFYPKDALDQDRTDQPFIRQTAWAYEEIHWQTGHTVEWAYLWNTETEPNNRTTGGGPQPDVTVAVVVQDLNGRVLPGNTRRTSAVKDTEDPSATTLSATEMRNKITVGIEPYVTGFERDANRATPLYATKRSRQGWYSFFRGESGIAVNGYNLTTSALTVNMTYGNNGASSPTTSTNNFTTSYSGGRHLFTVPPDSTVTETVFSGRINIRTVGTNAADIYNHTSFHTNRSWNRESSAYTDGSDLWINRPHAHIWDTGGTAGTGTQYSIGGAASEGLDSPGMALGYASGGTLHGAWSVYSKDTFYYGTNNNTSQVLRDGRGEPFSGTDISMVNGTGTPNVMSVFKSDGTTAIGLTTNINANADPHYIAGNPSGWPTDRWQNTRISKAEENGNTTQGNAGRVYMTSYDSAKNNLWFAMRYRSTAVDHSTVAAVIDGGASNNDGTAVSRTYTLKQAPKGDPDPYNTQNDSNMDVSLNGTNDYIRETHVSNNAYVIAGQRIYTVGAQASTGANHGNYRYVYAADAGIITNVHTATTGNTARTRLPNHTNDTGGTAYTITPNRISPATGLTTASTNAGKYSAVGYDSYGPIVAYYDQQNDTVRLAFGTLSRQDLGNTATITWVRRNLLPSTHALYRGSGQYISMKVDRRGAIHLAFYNSSRNTVVYAYALDRGVLNNDTTPTPITGVTPFTYGSTPFYVCTVDNVVRGGQWTDISVDNRGNPMIVYGDSSRMGNYDGVRIAYLVHTQSRTDATTVDTNSGAFAQNALLRSGWETLYCPVTGANITGWEALTMPANFTVNEDRLNIEVWPPTNRAGGAGPDEVGTLGTDPVWSAAVGYASDRFRVGYFYYPTWKGY